MITRKGFVSHTRKERKLRQRLTLTSKNMRRIILQFLSVDTSISEGTHVSRGKKKTVFKGDFDGEERHIDVSYYHEITVF